MRRRCSQVVSTATRHDTTTLFKADKEHMWTHFFLWGSSRQIGITQELVGGSCVPCQLGHGFRKIILRIARENTEIFLYFQLGSHRHMDNKSFGWRMRSRRWEINAPLVLLLSPLTSDPKSCSEITWDFSLSFSLFTLGGCWRLVTRSRSSSSVFFCGSPNVHAWFTFTARSFSLIWSLTLWPLQCSFIKDQPPPTHDVIYVLAIQMSHYAIIPHQH